MPTTAAAQRPTRAKHAPDITPRASFMGVPRKVMQSITALVIGALLNMALSPLALAYQHKLNQERAEVHADTPGEQYAWTVTSLSQRAAAQLKSSAAGLASNPLGDAATLETQANAIRAEWQQLRAQWQSAKVPQAIIARQLKIEAAFETQHRQLLALLQQPEGQPKAQAIASFLADNLPKRAHLPINLNNLPWQVQKEQRHAPALTSEELNQRLLPEKPTTAPSATLTVKSATPATAADLAATIDAPQSADITALAASLNHDPYAIYKWVYDNIEYTPTYGSVQGAQDTLDKKAGNDMDQASLLIALLRASGIAARYVVGTVEIPSAQAMNWIGGVKTTDAAQQLLGQGGVPNVALVSGGVISAIRIEHTWVEAFIQYYPGRGARHVAGVSAPDTWVPLDASYKQYSETAGMDLQTAVPLDATALATAAQQGATVNQAEGWVQNLNSAAIQSQLTAYQSQLQNYINSQNAGNSTVGNVLGTRTPVAFSLPYLPNTLPYTVRARSQQFSEVPNNLRAQFKYEIYADQTSANWGDDPLLSWQTPTVSIAGKKVTIAWVAATAADQAAIQALIPTPPAGQQLDPSQLPTGLSSAISLRPEIHLEGQTVATGTAMGAGSEPVGAGSFTNYYTNQWDTTTDQLIAGQQSAMGISIQGISQKQIDTLKTRMQATQATLQQAQAAPQSQQATILQGLTGENLTGDMLTATVWGYFASVQSQGVIASTQAGIYDRMALSYGLFHAQAQPRKLYGIVTTGLTFKGLNMDIGHMRYMRWVQDDNPQSAINNKPELTANGKSAAQNRWIAYNKMRGQYASAMEAAAPEAFWVDKTQCRYQDSSGVIQNPALADCQQAISAVKAIAIAEQQGQKVYTINQQNRATALPKLTIGGDVGDEIRNAINAGKEVTFHEGAINAYGWTGSGYSIIDPDTGVGSYLI